MKPYARAKRVSSQLQRVLTDILAKKIKDPRLELATVTGVNMSRDLRYARIYYVVNGDEKVELDETFDLLLDNLQAGGLAVSLAGSGAATANVINDDSATISIDDVRQVETNSGQTAISWRNATNRMNRGSSRME